MSLMLESLIQNHFTALCGKHLPSCLFTVGYNRLHFLKAVRAGLSQCVTWMVINEHSSVFFSSQNLEVPSQQHWCWMTELKDCWVSHCCYNLTLVRTASVPHPLVYKENHLSGQNLSLQISTTCLSQTGMLAKLTLISLSNHSPHTVYQ